MYCTLFIFNNYNNNDDDDDDDDDNNNVCMYVCIKIIKMFPIKN